MSLFGMPAFPARLSREPSAVRLRPATPVSCGAAGAAGMPYRPFKPGFAGSTPVRAAKGLLAGGGSTGCRWGKPASGRLEATDNSRGRELTPEWGVKRRRRHAPTLAAGKIGKCGGIAQPGQRACLGRRRSQVRILLLPPDRLCGDGAGRLGACPGSKRQQVQLLSSPPDRRSP